MTPALRERLQRYSEGQGPATCGCVASFLHEREMWVMSHHVKYPAWPLCPICHGSGVDPRVPGGVLTTRGDVQTGVPIMREGFVTETGSL